MKTLKNPYFLSALAIYMISKGMQKFAIHIPYVHWWLHDVLFVPILLNIALAFQRTFVYKDNDYIFNTRHVAFTVIYTACVFELIMPYFSKKYTADMGDVFAYAAGGAFYYLFMNVPAGLKRKGHNA